ncbi:unnamed protein product [Symbiodinium sp. CCMP2592]|nr:unnamed protein product [Symbiodinium sp. CCMP2592]
MAAFDHGPVQRIAQGQPPGSILRLSGLRLEDCDVPGLGGGLDLETGRRSGPCAVVTKCEGLGLVRLAGSWELGCPRLEAGSCRAWRLRLVEAGRETGGVETARGCALTRSLEANERVAMKDAKHARSRAASLGAKVALGVAGYQRGPLRPGGHRVLGGKLQPSFSKLVDVSSVDLACGFNVAAVLGQGVGLALFEAMCGAFEVFRRGGDGGQYLREAEDRRRAVDRLIKSAFFAEPPAVEIPRKAAEAELASMLKAKYHSPVVLWGNHQAGKSRLLWKTFHSMSLDQGVLHLHLTRNEQRAEAMLCSELGVETSAQATETLQQAAAALGRLPLIIVEVPRQIRDENALQSCSTFAKKFAYDAQLADVVVLASAAATALAFDADSREKRVFLESLSEQECEQQEVEEFLKHHGGAAAVEHKAELLHLTGGNVGKLEALGVKRGACALRSLSSLAGGCQEPEDPDLRAGPAGSHRRAGRVCFAPLSLRSVAMCQEQQILRFVGIDAQGGFGPKEVPAGKEVARRVADAPFHQCVRSKDFMARFTSQHLAQAVKAQGAHCIYVKATTKADERFCAASPSVHALLKPKTRWLGIF